MNYFPREQTAEQIDDSCESDDFVLYKLNVFGNPIMMLLEAVIRSPLMFFKVLFTFNN